MMKAAGWGILGFLASELFSLALGLALVGVVWLLGYLDPLVSWWNYMGFWERATVAVVSLLPTVAVGVAIRRRRRAFVVGWFLPVATAVIELIYFFAQLLLDDGFRNHL